MNEWTLPLRLGNTMTATINMRANWGLVTLGKFMELCGRMYWDVSEAKVLLNPFGNVWNNCKSWYRGTCHYFDAGWATSSLSVVSCHGPDRRLVKFLMGRFSTPSTSCPYARRNTDYLYFRLTWRIFPIFVALKKPLNHQGSRIMVFVGHLFTLSFYMQISTCFKLIKFVFVFLQLLLHSHNQVQLFFHPQHFHDEPSCAQWSYTVRLFCHVRKVLILT